MRALPILFVLCLTALLSTATPSTQMISHTKKERVSSLILNGAKKFSKQSANITISSNGEGLVVQHLIEDGDMVFDIGANKGDWSAHALNHHHALDLHIFEPIPEMCSILISRFASQATIHHCALSNTHGTKEFYCYPNNRLSSLYERTSVQWLKVKKVISVPTITLDVFCAQHSIAHINFLKIDTEGAEYAILSGAQNLISKKAIDFIQFEYGGCYRDAGTTLRQVFDLLTSNQYQIARITPQGLQLITHWQDTLEDYAYTNFVAISAPYATETTINF